MVGSSLLLVVAVAVVTWSISTPGAVEQTYVVPVPEDSSSRIDPTGAAQALQGLVVAINERDASGVAALAAPGDSATRGRLDDLVDVASEAEVVDVTMRYIDVDGGLAADGTWAAAVAATWAYSGFDDQPTTAEVSVRFGSTPGGVVIAGIGGGSLRTPVWMSGPMQVSRSRDLLVVAAVDTDLDAFVRLARSALPTVTSVVTDWEPQLVVEVPSDGASLESALGVERGYYTQIAAVTGSGGTLSAGAPIHIFVNPDVYSGLGRAGREVVLAHEVTHVATDAPRSEAPTWLVEGFADYVALRRTRLPLARTAGQVAQQVRDRGVPQDLPAASDYAAQGPGLGAVYEASWLACVVLAERADAKGLLAFYSSASRGAPVGLALRRELAWSTPELVRTWQDRLRRIAASTDGAAAAR